VLLPYITKISELLLNILVFWAKMEDIGTHLEKLKKVLDDSWDRQYDATRERMRQPSKELELYRVAVAVQELRLYHSDGGYLN
jgi:ABC-type bacteriocin/lantibiotic exporter with double-glycine peptidase domain